jgi:hypothetical protein
MSLHSSQLAQVPTQAVSRILAAHHVGHNWTGVEPNTNVDVSKLGIGQADRGVVGLFNGVHREESNALDMVVVLFFVEVGHTHEGI